MTRGRKPVPLSVHKTRGTLRKHRHAKRAVELPTPDGSVHQPPEHLTESQAAIWREVVAHAPMNVLRPIDRGILTVYVVALDQHRTAAICQTELDRDSKLPLLVKSKDGVAIASPYLRIARQSADTMVRAASELGFTPTARARIAAGPAPTVSDPASPWAKLKLLQGGRGDDDPPTSA